MKQANNLAQKVREYAKVYEPKDFIPVYGCFRAFWQLSGRYMDYYHKMGREMSLEELHKPENVKHTLGYTVGAHGNIIGDSLDLESSGHNKFQEAIYDTPRISLEETSNKLSLQKQAELGIYEIAGQNIDKLEINSAPVFTTLLLTNFNCLPSVS